MTAKDIRQSFYDFFRSKSHQIVPSAPMVIKDDPTLMFTNAGMNQFKDVILGFIPVQFPRIADSQKCLRVSGKHNDLEEVGHDTYHHTMFEMLGNWSFGDYFKKEAIGWAWEYLTDVLKIDKTRLYVTVFEGSAPDHLERDDEAALIWSNYLPANRILNGNKKDNFWEMGDTGPCGPCSEIHIDIRSDKDRKEIDGATLVNKDPQVIEIWNLVFMQYNRKADGSLDPLPAKVIDTGMGFERLCMTIQGKTSNYDTDVFQPIIQSICQLTDSRYGHDEKKDIAMRVVTDHMRTIAFSIADGQLPSNAKAGYVIRRILRRAVRYAYTFLDQKKAFMYRLLPALIDSMGDVYPELVDHQDLIEKVMKEEEESFLRTLETGIKLLDKVTADALRQGEKCISGTDVFTLYDTYGFPFDLTELILREKHMTVDKDGFEREMQQQKERARHAASFETGDWVVLNEGESTFVGFDQDECETQVLRYRQIKQTKQEYFQLVLDQTPFYAEMGGQVGDCGTLTNKSGEKIHIFDTKKENNLIVHLTKQLPGELSGTWLAEIDRKKRRAIECNHTATHLLHEALREILGKHVEQKGSLVSFEVLRFDFSHFQKVSNEEIRKIEQWVTRQIRVNKPLEEHRNIPITEAKAMGAMALFGEKYGDLVRTVRFGKSIELCGGTHAQATGNIGTFRIISENSIAAGIRRIEAITAETCENYIYTQQDIIFQIKTLYHNAPDLLQTIRKYIDENADLKKQLETFKQEKTGQLKKIIIENSHEVNHIRVFSIHGNFPPEIIKDIAFQLRGEFPEKMFFAAGCIFENKPHLILMISNDLVQNGLNASTIIKEAARKIHGGGGGQNHFATAGGTNPDGLSAALEDIKNRITEGEF